MIIDGFAGPGGWDQGLRLLDRHDVIGIEWDKSACETAHAAGFARLRADVRVMLADFIGQRVDGVIMSPPCQAWSSAGARKGELDRANCHSLADRMASGDDSTDWTNWEDARSSLVCEPVRWVRDLAPDWIALEEVPAVASLWEHFARIFRTWGYSVWTGNLLAADYGVPQTRTRQILIGRRNGAAGPPPPTHAKEPSEDLFGGELLPWVSMAEALGWGFDDPSCTVSAGGGATGGAEPFANANYRRRLAATVAGWGFTDRPAPTVMALPGGKGTGAEWGGSAIRKSMHAAKGTPAWAEKRPATTVVGSFRPDVIAAPGYRTDVSRQNAPDSIRVSVQEAGILQSFPADYPWQGTKTKQYEQVGNAIPPLLAAHVIQAAA